MKSVHLVVLAVVAFLMACGQTNPESSSGKEPTDPIEVGPIQTGPDQTGPRLSAQGVAWNLATVASGYNVYSEISMVLDANNRPVISYASTAGDLMLVRCGDTTCSSGNSIQKVDKGWYHNSLVLDASGHPVISYDFLSNREFFLRLVHCNDANCRGGVFQTLSDDQPRLPVTSRLVLDAAGKPVVSFIIDDGEQFVVLNCNDVNCATRKVSAFPEVAPFQTSLALDTNGKPVIGYISDHNSYWAHNGYGTLKLVRCGTTDCSSGNSTQIVQSGPSVSAQAPSLVLDSASRPVMAYYEAANKNLNVVHCGDATCSSGNSIKVVDNAGDVGNSPSLKLTALGIPVVAHGNATNGTLKLLQCRDLNCASGNVSQVVDSVGAGYATMPAMALDGNGNAVIAYGTSSGQLRLARQVANNITPPTITATKTGTLGDNGWYTSNVTLSWTIVDNGSALTASSGCGTVTYSTDVQIFKTCTATNGGGTTQRKITIGRDATKPVLNPTVNPNPVLKYLQATVNPNASDNLSGVVSQSCTPASTAQVGRFSVTCTARDSAGNTATATASYTVIPASQGIQNLINQVNGYFFPAIDLALKSQLLNILVAAQGNLAVSRPASVALLYQFISVVNSPSGIDRGIAGVLTASAQALIASINAGP